MSHPAVVTHELGKRYRLGTGATYGRLTESLSGALKFKRRQERLPSEFVWALKDVSLQVDEGVAAAIIGRNGAGKTTLLKLLSRITEPTRGKAVIRGRVGSLLEVGTGFHPELTGRENVFLNGAILGMSRVDIRRRFDEIVSFAEVERFIDTPVKRFSSGMYVRLAFSVAAHLEPDVLIIDEVLAVGDSAFQKKCLGRMGTVADEGRTVLFVSHNMAAVKSLCSDAHLLDQGALVASGPVDEIIDRYLQDVSQLEPTALGGRLDRQGNGRLRVISFGVRSPAGLGETAVTGKPVSFELAYEAESALQNVHVSLGVSSLLGDGVAYLSNEMSDDAFGLLDPHGCISCSFEEFPLLPGAYDITIHVRVNDVIADWIKQAARIHVVPGDFFGSGRLPPAGYGHTVVRHSWSASGV